jgi:hypothetical protein
MLKIILVFLCLFVFIGCASLQQAGKKAWGSSTQALEAARSQGKRLDLACSQSDCFNSCLDILAELEITVFKKNSRAGYIVAMGFKAAIDTTEVGIFFEKKSDKETMVEISCLNRRLLDSAAAEIFAELKKKFSVVAINR